MIKRQFKRTTEGLNLAARVNAAVAANVGEDEGTATAVAVSDEDAIVQTSRKRPRRDT
ncbi:MAG: hypothetical protein JOZ37_07060 [Actinobacteria bacterium]|nr:hypothetical protein [Actinomycetota bacterium]MBV9663708.1 hypothetical protein [Actinomycetota bacterium]MBV9935176.1 hypothetical protein [Actinomycetota bacterium]